MNKRRNKITAIHEMRSLYEGGMTVSEVAATFGVSTGKMHQMLIALNTHMRKVGTPKKPKVPKPLHHRYWRQEEINTLYELYPYMRAIDLAKEMNRSMVAIQKKAFNLGLKKDPASHFQIRSNAHRGSNSGNFKGYRRKSSKGYIVLYKPGNESATKDGLIMEHRYVMEQHIGRALRQGEVVHHINGIKSDNRIENLMLMKAGEHSALHNRERVMTY